MANLAMVSDYLSPMAKNEVSKLPEAKLSDFMAAFLERKKNPIVNLILAVMGFHYLYMGRIGIWFLYVFTGAGFGVWWVIDMFRAKGMAIKKNDQIAMEVLSAVR